MITVEECPDLRARFAALECPQPTGLTVLPDNFEVASAFDELYLSIESVTLSKVFEQQGLEVSSIFGDTKQQKYKICNSSTLLLPTIFLAAAILAVYPNAVSIILTSIEYLCKSAFTDNKKDTTIKFKIIEERAQTSKCRKVTYEGPVSGIQEISKVLLSNEEDE